MQNRDFQGQIQVFEDAFENKIQVFENEKQAFETENRAFETEKRAFENEKNTFKNTKESFESELARDSGRVVTVIEGSKPSSTKC